MLLKCTGYLSEKHRFSDIYYPSLLEVLSDKQKLIQYISEIRGTLLKDQNSNNVLGILIYPLTDYLAVDWSFLDKGISIKSEFGDIINGLYDVDPAIHKFVKESIDNDLAYLIAPSAKFKDLKHVKIFFGYVIVGCSNHCLQKQPNCYEQYCSKLWCCCKSQRCYFL